MYEKDSDMSFGPLTIEIEDAPGGTVWTIRLDHQANIPIPVSK